MPWYLLAEGQNFSHTIYDTQKIPLIRGGSFLLLDALEALAARINSSGERLVPISVAASQGLYRIVEGNDPEELRQRVQRELKAGGDFLCFSTAIAERRPGDSLLAIRNRLQYEVRQQQMRSPSFQYCKPEPCIDPEDGLRPAPRDGFNRATSVRKEKGWAIKRRLLATLCADDTINPTNDLEELSAMEEAEAKRLDIPPNIRNKMTIIYADGDSFGHFQEKLDEDGVQTFDRLLGDLRKGFLQKLHADYRRYPSWWKTAEGAWRIEILLWGGDDLALAVPAWLGWRTLQLFYEAVEELPPFHSGELEEKLTFSAGAVFCNHKAPISRMRAIAEELCSHAKQHPKGRKKGNMLAYQVLESFDSLGMGIADSRISTYGPWIKLEELTLEGKALGEICQGIGALKKSDFPRKKLYEAVEELSLSKEDTLSRDGKELVTSLLMPLHQLSTILGLTHDDRPYTLIHLAELWDYCLELR